MTVAALRKDDLPMIEETPAPADPVAAAPPAETKEGRFKLPAGRPMFDALWPPVVGVLGFVGLWAVLAPMVHTSLGALPGPGDVWTAFGGLLDEYSAASVAKAEAAASGISYSGPPTFVDQIFTSLQTVGLGFVLASLIAVPLGLVAGTSKVFNAAINPAHLHQAQDQRL